MPGRGGEKTRSSNHVCFRKINETMPPIHIRFSQGTLELTGDETTLAPVAPLVKHDARTGGYRARARDYGPVVLTLHRRKIPYVDEAKQFAPLPLRTRNPFEPRPHQHQALEAWLKNSGRGVVVMPTGSGKSYLAVMAMEKIQRPTLIVAPTIDLMRQWATQLESFFDIEVGMIGGGANELRHVTTTTYDSAVLRMEFIGDRFGMVVFDECHHLPGPMNRLAADMCLAPYRMGLTATPEREEDEELLYSLIGPLVHRVHIDELEGDVLSPYKTKRVYLELSDEELASYQKHRAVYTNFLRSNGITFNAKSDWGRFVGLCARLPHGRDVFKSYLEQKRIARAGRAKVDMVWNLIRRHAGERSLVFTADNDTAYALGRAFFLPVMTHRTHVRERKEFLEKFRSGEYPVLITSKVLNEGVDVPEASVGIVVSGSGSVREHVQRLGRILRAAHGKQATLYELISANTSEMRVSERRRSHKAYAR